jgi:hypothetical protein
MKYYLRFALHLEQEGTSAIYDPESFADTPIMVSVPEITTLLQHLISDFQQVAIVEPAKTAITKVSHHDQITSKVLKEVDGDSYPSAKNGSVATLNLVEDNAFIQPRQQLDPSAVKRLSTELARYLTTASAELSEDNFLTEAQDTTFSGIREAIELRNYFRRFIASDKKIYRNGYLYITAL